MGDLVLKNCNILTMDRNLSKARWVAVKNGIIVALGNRDDFSGEAKKVVDLEGKTVLPGFIDSHAHVAVTGLMTKTIDISSRVNSVKDIMDVVKEECEKDKTSRLMIFSNAPTFAYLEEKRYPTRWELDEVSGDQKVVLILWSLHGGIANSKALSLLPSMPEDIRDEVEPNGLFDSDTAAFYCMGHYFNTFSDEEIAGFYQYVTDMALANGITTIHNLDGMFFDNDHDIDVFFNIKDRLPIHFVPYVQTFNIKKVKDRFKLPRIGGCLCIDGDPDQLTICTVENFPSRPTSRGLLTYSDYYLYKFVSAAHAAGLQCAFHAIGERAIDQIINIYYRVIKEQGQNGLHHRIEHFWMPSDQHIAMAAELQITLPVQSIAVEVFGAVGATRYDALLPKEKADKAWMLPTFLKAGINMSNGSDTPCTPMDPLFWLDCIVNATDPKRRISLDDALRMNTINGAISGQHEKKSGSIEVGKDADFVVIDRDPYKVKGKLKDEITIEKTIVNGKIVFEND